jgi:hypothetical protein
MKVLFNNIIAMEPAGVLFHTHQVVREFQTKNVKNESQKILSLLLTVGCWPLAVDRWLLSCKNINGTKAMNIKGVNPFVGHEAAIKRPLNKAKEILVIFFITSF